MPVDFSLTSLATIARMPKRAVQLWADAGIIKPHASTMLAGSGVHRKFAREEVIIACIVAPFAKQKMAIGGLLALSLAVRRFFKLGKSHPEIDVIEAALAGRGRHYLVVSWCADKSGGLSIRGCSWVSDEFRSTHNFYDVFGPSDADFKTAAKFDVIPVNEALREMPR